MSESHETPPRHEDERTQARCERGVDFGRTGRILAETRDDTGPVMRLVWLGASKAAAAGVRGFGRVAVPTRLAVVNLRRHHSETIFRTGRLSPTRLRAHADAIDAAMGAGVARHVEIGRTLIIEPPKTVSIIDDAVTRGVSRLV